MMDWSGSKFGPFPTSLHGQVGQIPRLPPAKTEGLDSTPTTCAFLGSCAPAAPQVGRCVDSVINPKGWDIKARTWSHSPYYTPTPPLAHRPARAPSPIFRASSPRSVLIAPLHELSEIRGRDLVRAAEEARHLAPSVDRASGGSGWARISAGWCPSLQAIARTGEKIKISPYHPGPGSFRF